MMIRNALRYISVNWLPILVTSLVFGVFGFCYSTLKKPVYTAICTFVLEDSNKGGSLGQYSNLATMAGLSLGGNGGGIFEGDNILELYTSRSMVEQALLSSCNINGKNQMLIDRYIEKYKLRNKWKDEDNLSTIEFNGDPNKFNRVQDSIIIDLVDLLNEKNLNVTKPDKKLNIIKVEVSSKDELFSKCFAEKLVQNVNDFYIKTKTKKSYQNVQILQHQADSVKLILNSSINGVASAIDADPNANPLMSALRVSSQKKQVDVQANTAIYSEMVKNLELAKISFRQEMPLVQVIDNPILPLHKDHITKMKASLIGLLIGAFLSIFFLISKRVYGIFVYE